MIAPMVGSVAAVRVELGDPVRSNEEIVVLESMKMEYPVRAGCDGVVAYVAVSVGDVVDGGQLLVEITPGVVGATAAIEPDRAERSDLTRLREHKQLLSDDSRQEAVDRRRRKGRRTARENVADLLDPGSFIEYGGLAVAAQRGRRSDDELRAETPADGLITGIGTVEGSPCAVIAYDYTVLAGTQGYVNHRKLDRMLGVVRKRRLPVVLFAEGGGGRPGDVDAPVVAGLDVPSFAAFGSLSGLVPLVGVVAGYCFAGNAALLGACDVVIATEDSNIGMAGPAMIEGGGLGRVDPRDIGPIDVQWANGTVDVRVADEAAAVAAARRVLGLLRGERRVASRLDQGMLRDAVPEQRGRIYDVRAVIDTLLDVGSVVELGGGHGAGIVTVLGRLQGRPVALVANDCTHLGGAIDRDGATKMLDFLALAAAHQLPVVSLCDTPGFMVGPEAEARGQVRPFARLFTAASRVTAPWVTVVLRKGYGLGAQAMAGGGFHAKDAIVSWPTGEFGGMGIEGAVRLGFRRELEAAGEGRDELEARLIAAAYERGGALPMASHVEIDDVIDPADTAAVVSALIERLA